MAVKGSVIYFRTSFGVVYVGFIYAGFAKFHFLLDTFVRVAKLIKTKKNFNSLLNRVSCKNVLEKTVLSTSRKLRHAIT